MAKYGSGQDGLSDDDLLAMGAGSRSGGSAWLGRGFVVLALTLAAGYYVPLHRTHQALITEYTTLAERVGGVEKDLTRARADLAALAAKNQELSQAQKKEPSDGPARSRRLQGELSAKLSSRIEKQELSIGVRNGHVAISLPAPLKQVQSHWDVTPAGQSALCDVAGAMPPAPSTLIVAAELGEAKTGPGAPSARDAAASRAGAIARALEQKCSFPGDRIATMTEAREAGSSGSAILLRIETP